MSHMLIDYYKAIEDSSAKMLQAAQSKDWDGVVRYEGTCAVLIEQLRFKAQEHELLPEHKREKTRIMQRILRNDLALIEEVAGLIAPVAQSWSEIGTNNGAAAQGAGA